MSTLVSGGKSKVMIDLTQKERAINKVKTEINKNIAAIIEMAKHCGYGELLYYLAYLHFIRLIRKQDTTQEDEQVVLSLYARQATEALKYTIQIIVKYSAKCYIKNEMDGTSINESLVQSIIKSSIWLNSQYEMLFFFTMFNNLEVLGKRNQKIRIDMKKALDKDESLKRYLLYAARVEIRNNIQSDNLKIKDDFLTYFKKEYAAYSDLFQQTFGISIDTFIGIINWILDTISAQVKNNEKKFVFLENGNISAKAYGTIMYFGQSLLLEKKLLFNKFGKKIKKIITRLTYKPEEFDEQQLKYNLIARQPIINFDSHFLIISPEILLDSLFVNTHYSLLETGQSKEEYKKRYSKTFIDKISKKASKVGFLEVGRGLELYEDGDNIGDIDLILKNNNNNHFLLVEAKNHALPLDVYFHDFEATRKRLKELTEEWENKVDRRYKHLKANHSKYGIGDSFKYIIVSRSPEIISHFSQYLIVSLDEFERIYQI